MNRKQLTLALMISAVSLSGCSTYRIVKIEEGKDLDPGYHVLRRNVFIDEFVIDENGNHPQDLSIAKERLKRRRKMMEEWYKKYYPDALQENIFTGSIKAIIFAPFFPLFLIAEGFDNPRLTEGQLENKIRKNRKAEEEIMRFISEDVNKEKMVLELDNPLY